MVPERDFMFGKEVIRCLITLTGIVIVLNFSMQCDNGTNPPDPQVGPLELLYPKGSDESFKVGDTVPIRWSIHDQSKVQAVGMSYSLDGGKTVTNSQLIVNKSVNFPDTSYRWVIADRHVSDQFVLIIWEYQDGCLTGSSSCVAPHDKSAPFKISQ